MRTIQHWIDGASTDGNSERTSVVYNPALGVAQAAVVLGNAADIDLAVQSAIRAFSDWSEASMTQRSHVLFAFREILNARSQELAEVITAEHGKLVSDAAGEIQRGLEVVEFACGLPSLLKGEYSDQVSTGVDSYSFREPLGVVAGITPFNFPAMVPMWMYPIAIAMGNTFVLKPSERDPSASMLVAEMWAEAGLPAGVFNVVHGDKEAVDAILDHIDISAVSFVGSTPIARYIHTRATERGKRVQALGGAKNHAIVMPDADLDFATGHVTAAAFGSAGERCMAISTALLVGDSTASLEALAEKTSAIKVGVGTDAANEMGPIISAAARERIISLITSGEREGADVLVDGRELTVDGYENGFFVGPTLVDGVTPDMEMYREEIFGPVLATVRVETVEEAIALINSNPYGNGTAIFTSSGGTARRFVRGVQVGMVGVNVPVPVPMAYHSFGGWKDSLFGEHHIYGLDGVRFFTKGKVVTTRWPEDAAKKSERPTFNMPTAN